MSESSYSVLYQDPLSHLKFRQRHGQVPAQARLVLLHGVGGNETNLAGLAEAVDPRVEVLLVQGPLNLGPAQFAWFPVRFGANGPQIDEAHAERSRRLLIDFIEARTTLPTVIAGFSQGGIMSASVGLSAPQAVNGFGLLSGRILPELAPHIASTEALGNLQAFVAHGCFDDKLPLHWAERAEQWLEALQVRQQVHIYECGHELIAQEATDFLRWLAGPLGL
ncbi:phospholipase [Pseudomonas sp. dw_358]|uniref:alpha/beta hydrolase n=1 Tax=Pseudomonas sp. dw_358 TaxID=2720083 RepID=UPI001BD6538F|nr:phospholipase [Pseudomonas sp. dw_358]